MNWRQKNLHGELSRWREQIKETDLKILNLVRKRMNISEKIGEIKMACGLPIFDPTQEAEVIESRFIEGQSLGLQGDLVEELIVLLMKHSKRIQQRHVGFEDCVSDLEVNANVTLALR